MTSAKIIIIIKTNEKINKTKLDFFIQALRQNSNVLDAYCDDDADDADDVAYFEKELENIRI